MRISDWSSDVCALPICASSRPLLAGLAEAIGMCANLDERFEKLCSQLDKSDPAKAQTLRSTALFEVRQRHTDLITQMAVSQQSYAMLGLIGTNNNDLIKGIDRASSTTIARPKKRLNSRH